MFDGLSANAQVAEFFVIRCCMILDSRKRALVFVRSMGMLKPAIRRWFRNMSTRKKRASEVEYFEEKKVEVAAGGSSGGSGRGSGSGSGSSGGGFSPGQDLSCKVIRKEPGGYTVHVGKDKLQGFLPTQEELEMEIELIATYVCMHNGRLLLSARFSTNPSGF